MFHDTAIRHLYWKESKQAALLAVLLVAIGILAYCVINLSVAKDELGGLKLRFYILTALPILFAIGVGALLIGQEREQRTIEWLQTLPITSRDLVRVKLHVAVLGLAGIWIASWLIDVTFRQFNGPSELGWYVSSLQGLELITFPLQTLFVLLAGVTLAWWIRSSLYGLLLLVPIALLPGVVLQVLAVGVDMASWQMVTVLLGFTLVALALSWLAGLSSLAANEPRGGFSAISQQTSRSLAGTLKTRSLPHAPSSALLWQFARQNAVLLLTSIVLTVGTIVSHTLIFGIEDRMQLREIMLLLVGLLVSWMGAWVFVGERLHGRIGFLADRGVSPIMVWCTRHALPLMVMALIFALSAAYLRPVGSTVAALFFMAMICGAYVLSQWIGQLIRSPVIAAVSAPALAAVFLWNFGFVSNQLGAPVSLLIIVSMLPLIATLLLMRRWMDGRTDVRFWTGHAICLAACLLIPGVPMLWVVYRPGTPSKVIKEIESFQAIGMPLSQGRLSSLAALLTQTPLTDNEHRLRERLSLGRNHENDPPARGTWDLSMRLRAEATRARWSAQQKRNDQAVIDYRGCIYVLVAHVRGSRYAPGDLMKQAAAVSIERWLLDELQAEHAESLIDEPLRVRIQSVLSDVSGRRLARQHAVINSWSTWQQEVPSGLDLGGFWLANNMNWFTMYDRLQNTHRIEHAFAHLWILARDGQPAATAARLSELATLLGLPPEIYDIDQDVAAMEWERLQQGPGILWGGSWETQVVPEPTTTKKGQSHVDD